MGSIVIELQREALDRSVGVADLLRKALVVSRKLDLAEFSAWISHELDGYPAGEPMPEYRKLTGDVKAWNPFHGWIPIVFNNPPEVGEQLSRNSTGQSIAEIEALVSGAKNGESQVIMYYSKQAETALMSFMSAPMRPALHIPVTQLHRILDSVRNAVLKWSLQLENDGILGKGLTFSPKEKKIAQREIQNVNNFYGNVSNSQIQQASDGSTQTINVHELSVDEVAKFVHRLKQAIPTLNLTANGRSELAAEVATMEAQIASPKPKHTIIRESLLSIRSILENAAGNALGNAASGAAGGALLTALLKLLGVQ